MGAGGAATAPGGAAGKGGAAGQGAYGTMDPYTQAATAQGNAMGATQGAMGAMGTPGFGTYGANRQQGPGAIARGMDRYMNPYTQDVIDANRADTMTSLQQAQSMNGANAQAAGAFGGSRHGLVEATTAADAIDNLSRQTAGLRQQGFDTAAALSGQDVANRMAVRGANQNAINTARQFNAGQAMAGQQGVMQGAAQLAGLGAQSFGYGNTLQGQQAQQGQQGQDMANALLGQGAGMFDRYVNQPTDLLNIRLGSLGVNPLTRTGTQTGTSQYNPGAMDWLGMGMGAMGAK